MVYIIRYSEIGTKGKNRKDFEKKLVENLKYYFTNKKLNYTKIERTYGRILVYCDETKKLDFRRIFGISSYSRAIETKAEIEEIKTIILQILKNKKFNSFRISANRIDKNFNMSSIEIEKSLGKFVVDTFNKKVFLKDFDIEISVEFYQKKAFIFTEKIQCFSGLPVGSEGNVYALIEDKNSALASILMMKRGCSIFPVAFKKTNISKLQEFMLLKRQLRIIKNFDELDERISRFIVTGQTLENFKDLKITLLVLRPLVAFNQEEINKLEKKYK